MLLWHEGEPAERRPVVLEANVDCLRQAGVRDTRGPSSDEQLGGDVGWPAGGHACLPAGPVYMPASQAGVNEPSMSRQSMAANGRQWSTMGANSPSMAGNGQRPSMVVNGRQW